MKSISPMLLQGHPRRKRGLKTLPAGIFPLALIACLFFFSGCASYGPAPPVVVSAPTAEGTASGHGVGTIPIVVIPTRTPLDMADLGTLFHQDGTYSQLVPKDPVGPALDTILLRTLSEAGFSPTLAQGAIPSNATTISVSIETLEDRVLQSLVEAKQTVRIAYTATLVLHEGRTTRTITRKIERHFSPKPTVSFDPKKLPLLMGDLYAKSIRKDLLPTLKTKIGATR
ncbi:MAG: hypothetical protein ACP5OP_03040 [Leptospirillia bacterium]